ncbi:MAG: adenylate/guanylate cyclase domain-containing protein, partial [Acetobacteraceae bacterium]
TVRFEGNRAIVEPFMTGLRDDAANSFHGRPAGLLFLPDGSLHEALRAGLLPDLLGWPGAARALRHVPPGAPGALVAETWRFLGPDGTDLHTILRALPWRDPRQAPWAAAPDGGVPVLLPLGLGETTGRPGFRLSRRLAAGAVVSVELDLASVAALLDTARPSPRSLPVLFSATGALLAHRVPERALTDGPDGRQGVVLGASGNPLLDGLWAAAQRDPASPGGTVAWITRGRDGVLAAVAPVDVATDPPMLAGLVTPAADFTGPLASALEAGITAALGAFALGLAAIGLIAARIARPLAALTREAEAIRALDLAEPVRVRSRIVEVERLASAMATMKGALRQFGAYVPAEVVRRLVETGPDGALRAERRPVTVLFTDMEGFTRQSERLDPETLRELTSLYLAALSDALQRHGATIDKFIGDAVMAYWNAPRPDALHACRACAGALAAREASDALAPRFAAAGWPGLRTRIGVHTGEAVVGVIGSTERRAYTAVGSVVNLASRLEALNAHYGTTILVSDATRRAAGARFLFRPVDLVLVKGASRPVEIHELVGPADERPRAELSRWEEMVRHYRAGAFDRAAAALAEAAPPGDALARAYGERLAALRDRDPPQDWSPVVRFDGKHG